MTLALEHPVRTKEENLVRNKVLGFSEQWARMEACHLEVGTGLGLWTKRCYLQVIPSQASSSLGPFLCSPLGGGTLDFKDLLNEANIEEGVGEAPHSEFPWQRTKTKAGREKRVLWDICTL